MRNTIKSQVGYYLETYHGRCTIYEGKRPIFQALLRTYNDYLCEKQGNECFVQYEVFTTNDGQQYIYWVDWEIDADYITKVPREVKHA